MAHMVYDGGVWKPVNNTWTYDTSVWKPVDKGWVYDAGIWKPFFSGAQSIYPNTYFSGNPSNTFIQKINANGELVWEYNGHTSTAYGLAVNSTEYLHTCAPGDNSYRKLDPNGNEVWVRSITSPYDIAVDTSDNVYLSHSGGVTKYASDGTTVIWSDPFAGNYGRIEVLSTGEVYVSYGTSLRKISSTGSQLWTITRPNTITAIGVDTNGDVYAVDSFPTFSNNLSKYDSAGNLIYSVPYGSGTDLNDIVVGDGLYVYVSISGTDKIASMLKSNGSLSTYIGPSVGSFATNRVGIDPDGFIRIGRGSGILWKYNINGTLAWFYNNGGFPYERIVVDPGKLGAGFWI